MLESPSIDIIHLFFFVIPGFITVWTFRFFTDSKKSSDFEYFALSVFWGLMLLLFNEMLAKKEALAKLLENPYATATVFSAIGFVFGIIEGMLSKEYFFKRFITWLKSRHF